MPRLGWPEILLMLFVILVFFGVGKLPQIGESLGKGIRAFRKTQSIDEEKAAAEPLESHQTGEKPI